MNSAVAHPAFDDGDGAGRRWLVAYMQVRTRPMGIQYTHVIEHVVGVGMACNHATRDAAVTRLQDALSSVNSYGLHGYGLHSYGPYMYGRSHVSKMLFHRHTGKPAQSWPA